MVITSLDNKKIKRYIKLKEKKYRDLYDEFIIEGEHLVREAYKKNMIKELILVGEEEKDISFPNVLNVSENIMKKITNLDTFPKVCAVCYKIKNEMLKKEKYLLLDHIQDPGNLGTIIRSAVAFDIDTIVLSLDTVDLYNPKVLRATQGMLFHIPIIRKDLVEMITYLKENKIKVYTTDVTGGVDVRDLSLKDKTSFALIMGSEGQGVKNALKDLSDEKIYIPMNHNVESLNVSIATAILLYEFGRK